MNQIAVILCCSLIPLIRSHPDVRLAFVHLLCTSHHARRTSVLPSLKSNADEQEKQHSIAIASNVLSSLRRHTASSSGPLNLETHFYDSTTGLHSEGVWHNCLAGMASLKLAELQHHSAEENFAAAQRIANSLWEYSWDDVSMQRRSWSGSWDHSRLQEGVANPPEQANYYNVSTEHRCIQHGAAVMFWSKLIAQLCTWV